MWHGKILYGKYYLVMVCQSSTYNIVKVIKLFKKVPQRILGDFYDNYFYNFFIFTLRLIGCAVRPMQLLKLQSTSCELCYNNFKKKMLLALWLVAAHDLVEYVTRTPSWAEYLFVVVLSNMWLGLKYFSGYFSSNWASELRPRSQSLIQNFPGQRLLKLFCLQSELLPTTC